MGLSNLLGRKSAGSMLSGLSVAAIVIILFRDYRQPRSISICDPGSLEMCQSRMDLILAKAIEPVSCSNRVISSLSCHGPQDITARGRRLWARPNTQEKPKALKKYRIKIELNYSLGPES